jgi:hypothetical protein
MVQKGILISIICTGKRIYKLNFTPQLHLNKFLQPIMKKVTKNPKNALKRIAKSSFRMTAVLITACMSSTAFAQAAKGVAALEDARTSLNQYFEAGVNVSYGAAAIIGLIGAVKVYQKWTNGDPDTGKVAGAWLGGAIFLAAVTTVLRVVFIQ